MKLFGIKDFATLQALDKLRVFVSGNDSYPGVFAGGCHRIGFSSIMMLFPTDCSGLSLNFKRQMYVALLFPLFYLLVKGALEPRQSQSYTKHGPKKSDIACSS